MAVAGVHAVLGGVLLVCWDARWWFVWPGMPSVCALTVPWPPPARLVGPNKPRSSLGGGLGWPPSEGVNPRGQLAEEALFARSGCLLSGLRPLRGGHARGPGYGRGSLWQRLSRRHGDMAGGLPMYRAAHALAVAPSTG